MKTFLVFLGLIASSAAFGQANIGISAAARGDYFGVCLPSPKCSNERLAIEINVGPNGELTGHVLNWEGSPVIEFDGSWPFFKGTSFKARGFGDFFDRVEGKFSVKSGTLSGRVFDNGGCSYTFKAFRRFKVAQ